MAIAIQTNYFSYISPLRYRQQPFLLYKNKFQVYLSGAIERAPDLGVSWRERIKQDLDINPIFCWDPLIHEKANVEAAFAWPLDSTMFRAIMAKTVNNDLAAVEDSDLVIVNLDKYCGTGTAGEITWAYTHNIPVWTWINKPLEDVSKWIMGCTEKIFNSYEELVNAIRKEVGAKPLYDREGKDISEARDKLS